MDKNKEVAVTNKSKGKAIVRNALIMLVILGVFVFAYFNSDRFQMHVQYIFRVLSKGDLQGLRDYFRAWGAWAPIVSALIMIMQSVVAPLPAFIITVTNGLVFGVFWGTLLSWSSAMVGAVLCFYIARSLGRPAAERFVSKKALSIVDGFFARYGNNSVLIARLLPVVSFDAVSYAAGLTSISFWGFITATGIGQLPATIVYSWLGDNLTRSVQLGLYAFLALAVLLVVGLTVKQVLQRRHTKTEVPPASASSE